ncbi:MAG: hypothetical protein IKX57_01090 [Oscillospiraceae bacterium]|nr:hypothetical protein [Oscillospiraceae bacterium]
MKKKTIRLLTLLLCIVLFMAGTAVWAGFRAEQEFQTEVQISAQNVPEGTCYADLLVQLPEKDKLRVPDTGVRLSGADITENSEIFRYNKDNYVSASLHYGYAQRIELPDTPDQRRLTTVLALSGHTKDGRFSRGKEFLRIPSFRIAYVSQDGTVLGVTGPAEAVSHFTPVSPQIPFSADGSDAHYDITVGDDWNPAAEMLTAEGILLVLLLLIAIPVYAVIAAVRRHREREAVIARIQQNAADANGGKTRSDE